MSAPYPAAETLTPADVLARAERRLSSLIRTTGRADDPMVLAVLGTYEALYRAALDGAVIRSYETGEVAGCPTT